MEQNIFEKKVYLVGAGPGDFGLLTIKGKELLMEAETVVFDALCSDEILGLIPEGARQIYVGKRSGSHSRTQEEINRILVEEGKQGRLVVRLKGGDPFVFGRGGEEAAALSEHHIPFEVVPGVTSAVAAPAYCGIPVTHRKMASSFHVITGHAGKGKTLSIDYEALVRCGGTLIFLMGVEAAPAIRRGLLEAGMDPETPAAFLQEGTTPGQKKVISTLKHLIADGEKAGISPPAVVIVGQVCSLEDRCSWAEKRSLSGKRVLVTRPRSRASLMTARLRAAGAQVMELPAVRLKLPEDFKYIDRAIDGISRYGWLVFTSPGGAEIFFERMAKLHRDIRRLSGIKIAVIGTATGEIFLKRGICPDYIPERYYAKELGEGLAKKAVGERVLILRSKKGSPMLTHPLAEAGVEYDDIVLYEPVQAAAHAMAKRAGLLLKQRSFDYVTFTSGSTVHGFMETFKPGKNEIEGFMAVCIGEETKRAASACGMKCIMAAVPSIDSMIEEMKKDAKKDYKHAHLSNI